MNINELAKDIHNWAKSKGWWDIVKSPLECHMMIVTEIAEATEECRTGAKSYYLKDGKPEGEAIELADALIRILDYAEYSGFDMEEMIKLKMDYNQNRPYRHGNKKY